MTCYDTSGKPRETLAAIEDIAGRVREALVVQRLVSSTGVTDTRKALLAVNEVLFKEMGFRGCTEHYHHPDNWYSVCCSQEVPNAVCLTHTPARDMVTFSYLSAVLKRRQGMPLPLCVLYQAVCHRSGIPDVHCVSTVR